MNTKKQSIEEYLKERVEALHNELLSNSTYVELLKAQRLIEFNQQPLYNFKVVEDAISLNDIKEYEKKEANKESLVNEEDDNTYGNNGSLFNTLKSKPNKFPVDGNRVRGRQVEFIVANSDNAITKLEIENRLEKRIGERVNVREALKRAIRKGELVYVKFNKSHRYAFVAMPEWITEDSQGKKYLKKEYSPDINELPMNLDYKNQEIITK